MTGFVEAVWLECRDEDGQIGDFNTESVYTAWNGFRLLGVETRRFRVGQTPPAVKEHAIVGNVGTVQKYLAQLDVKSPRVESAPAVLHPLFHRRLWTTTLGEVRKHLDGGGDLFFIKPLHAHKLFTGHVLGRSFNVLSKTAFFDDSVEILASEIVEYVSEYRGFICNRELVGFRHYAGDFRRIPDARVIDQALAWWGDDAPAACSIDLGLRRDGTTDIVEVNDASSLGAYGLPSIPYARMIEARWCEMVDLR